MNSFEFLEDIKQTPYITKHWSKQVLLTLLSQLAYFFRPKAAPNLRQNKSSWAQHFQIKTGFYHSHINMTTLNEVRLLQKRPDSRKRIKYAYTRTSLRMWLLLRAWRLIKFNLKMIVGELGITDALKKVI